jgi:hypothetical protein
MTIMSWTELKKRLNLNTGFFETSAYTLNTQMQVTSGNHDGAGMSGGNLQYNYGPADRLQELWLFMLNNHDAVVQASFGTNTAEYTEFDTMTRTYTRAERITWADGITDFSDGEGRALLEPWKSIFADLLIQPETIDKYLAMQDAYYVPLALDLFKQLDCDSRASLASIFDLNVNRGRFYPCNTLVIDFENIDADDVNFPTAFDKEAEKIRMINVRGNDRTNAMGDSAQWFVQRRECQGNQGGDYYGSPYDPETDFDITQEIAIQEKATSLGVNLGTMLVDNVFLGTSPISSIYLGANLLGSEPEPYTTTKVPQTQFRTNDNNYQGIGAVTDLTLTSGQPLWIDVQNWMACKTYYTTDGTTPTTASALYHEQLSFTESCTLKTLTVSSSGVAEPVKTLNITIPVASTGYRYVRFIGHGDETGITTRLVELQVYEGGETGTKRLLDKLPINNYTAPNGGTIEVATNGLIDASGYPYWWIAEGVPELIYDMGATYPIDTMRVCMSSPVADPRQTQFKVYVSTDNVTWDLVEDYSANTTVQPNEGFIFTI